ncbi:tubulin epsilon and delta complex protein 2 [Osmerus mordax]|uniref:tubulin epsilon and delta complex protein 2 n=1 Tax=Osmerus mordax TaxID=8014 RepID=UPI003510AC54
MSLLSVVDEAIRLCNAEEARINENINQSREILASMRPVKKPPKEIESANLPDKDSDLPPEEREEMELLQRVLEKALRVRSSAPTKQTHICTEPRKDVGDALKKTTKGGVQGSGSTKDKSAGTKPAERKVPVPSSSRGGRRRPSHQLDHGRASLVRGSVQKRSVEPGKRLPNPSMKEKPTIPGPATVEPVHFPFEYTVCVGDSGKDTATSLPIHEDPVSACHIVGSTSVHLPQPQIGISSQMLSKWRTLKNKQNRLSDKVMETHFKPVPEKTRFAEQMRATFPSEWPSGSPADIRAQMETLTGLGKNLTHCYQTQLLLANQTSRSGRQPAWKNYESWLMLGGLEKMVTDLQQRADKLRQEWGAWDRWRPAGGSLCPIWRRGRGWGEVGEGVANTPLPPIVTYSSPAELRELEGLRLGLQLLEQEIHLQEALCGSLCPCLLSMLSGPAQLPPALLRDIYALLGEGGEQFPALVLDTEPG